jgi:hypothetical protein
MASKWKSILRASPINGQTVWIRSNLQGMVPVEATYNLILQEFTTTTTSLLIPAYCVCDWQSL